MRTRDRVRSPWVTQHVSNPIFSIVFLENTITPVDNSQLPQISEITLRSHFKDRNWLNSQRRTEIKERAQRIQPA